MIRCRKITIACITKFTVKNYFLWSHANITPLSNAKKNSAFSLNHIHKWHTCFCINIHTLVPPVPDLPMLLCVFEFIIFNFRNITLSVIVFCSCHLCSVLNIETKTKTFLLMGWMLLKLLTFIHADSILMDHYHNSMQMVLLSFGLILNFSSKFLYILL